eukprot:921644_1
MSSLAPSSTFWSNSGISLLSTVFLVKVDSNRDNWKHNTSGCARLQLPFVIAIARELILRFGLLCYIPRGSQADSIHVLVPKSECLEDHKMIKLLCTEILRVKLGCKLCEDLCLTRSQIEVTLLCDPAPVAEIQRSLNYSVEIGLSHSGWMKHLRDSLFVTGDVFQQKVVDGAKIFLNVFADAIEIRIHPLRVQIARKFDENSATEDRNMTSPTADSRSSCADQNSYGNVLPMLTRGQVVGSDTCSNEVSSCFKTFWLTKYSISLPETFNLVSVAFPHSRYTKGFAYPDCCVRGSSSTVDNIPKNRRKHSEICQQIISIIQNIKVFDLIGRRLGPLLIDIRETRSATNLVVTQASKLDVTGASLNFLGA